jgi:hypothetical protein
MGLQICMGFAVGKAGATLPSCLRPPDFPEARVDWGRWERGGPGLGTAFLSLEHAP